MTTATKGQTVTADGKVREWCPSQQVKNQEVRNPAGTCVVCGKFVTRTKDGGPRRHKRTVGFAPGSEPKPAPTRKRDTAPKTESRNTPLVRWDRLGSTTADVVFAAWKGRAPKDVKLRLTEGLFSPQPARYVNVYRDPKDGSVWVERGVCFRVPNPVGGRLVNMFDLIASW